MIYEINGDNCGVTFVYEFVCQLKICNSLPWLLKIVLLFIYLIKSVVQQYIISHYTVY